MRDALIIPTYGFITSEDSPGGRGTKARIAVAQKLIREGKVERICMTHFPQNMLPRGRELELLGPVPLGKNVADYVQTLSEFGDAYVTDECAFHADARNGTKGTFDDTIRCLNEAFFETEEWGNPSIHVHFVSDWSQLGRLWLIWHAWKHSVRKLGWKANFHLVPNFRTMRDVWLHEPPAYLKCLFRCIKWRFFTV